LSTIIDDHVADSELTLSVLFVLCPTPPRTYGKSVDVTDEESFARAGVDIQDVNTARAFFAMVKGFEAGEWSPHNQRCKCRTDPSEPMRCDHSNDLEGEVTAEGLHKLAILLRLFGKKDLIIFNGGGNIINPFKAVMAQGLHLSLCTYFCEKFGSFEA
jgi:hypothetical protein